MLMLKYNNQKNVVLFDPFFYKSLFIHLHFPHEVIKTFAFFFFFSSFFPQLAANCCHLALPTWKTKW